MMFVALNLHLVNDAISFLLFLPGPELESAEVMSSGYLSRLPLMVNLWELKKHFLVNYWH